jgi:hypothetical protein
MLIARGNRTLPRLFQIGQEKTHQIRRDFGHGEPLHEAVQLARDERNQQRQRIAVTALRIESPVAPGYQVLE